MEVLKNREGVVKFTGNTTTKKMLKLIKPHYIVSKKVKSYNQIKSIVEEMKVFVDSEFNEGLFVKAYSLAHCEVSTNPYAFFIINSDFIKKKVFKHQVIINPEIVNVPEKIKFKADEDEKENDNNMEIVEACMMFPFRKPKKLSRPYRIEVKYQIPFMFGTLLTIWKEFEGLQSQIFQHNYQHCLGQNIFFKS